MGSTGTQTPYMNLNQWQLTDSPGMNDFNTDNQKIESAVMSHSHKGNGDGVKIAYADILNTPSSLPANGGNAATATKLQTARSINGTAFDGSTDITLTDRGNQDKDISVAREFRWRNYGNNHTVVDNSGNSYPGGNSNAQNYWTPSYPMLVGYNGANTFGVKVDTARYAESASNADTVDGSHGWQWQSLSASGTSHGGSWVTVNRHNVDGDGYFKIVTGDGSIGTKVDRSGSSGWADNAGWANTASYTAHRNPTEMGLRNVYEANWGPSGGSHTDIWLQYV